LKTTVSQAIQGQPEDARNEDLIWSAGYCFATHVEGHGDVFRRNHDRARRKRIFIDYQSLDNGQAGSGMQLVRSWSGLRALQPPVEGRGHDHGHSYARRKGITKSLGLAFAFLPGKKAAPEEAI
jgi:hypothetical protein